MKNVWLSPGNVITVLLLFVTTVTLQAQMQSHVTSAADDQYAHVYDFEVTPLIDESMDGICEDSMHRCTLRAALEEASILGQWADVHIEFNDIIQVTQGSFGPPDNSIISATGFFPAIDGNDIPAIFAIENQVTIYGLTLKNALYGIVIGGNNNLIGSVTNDKNRITNMSQAGILIAGDDNRIVGNWLGLDLGGAASGSKYGIFITGRNNTIGGSDVDQGNVISGNDIGIGVYTFDTLGVSKNYIKGNFIGTNRDGTQAIPNRVGIDNIGPGLAIGGLTDLESNVISGNSESGILIGIGANRDVFIGGNHIGVDQNGTLPIPNRDGITLGPGTLNCVVENNFIAYNSQNGILISGIPDPMLKSKNNIIRGNTIFSNANAGIVMTGAAEDNIIGSSLSQSYSPNQIDSNGAYGVLIAPGIANPERNTIRENSFHDNTGFGILIVAGQGGIQPPVIESYADNGSTAIVVGTHALAGATIDLYAGDVNQTNRLEGIEWLGSGPVDASGFFSIQISSCICDSIVSTATDAIGNTSEFSDGIGTITSLEEQPNLILSSDAYPNPFDKEVTIRFTLPESDNIKLDIYDVMGQKIKTLVNEHLLAGDYQYNWTPAYVSEGMYYYKFVIDSFPGTTGKLIFINN